MNTDTHTGPSFSLKNRLVRLFWGLTWGSLGRFSPRPLHAWRSFLLRAFGARIGRGVHIYPGVRIWAPWNLEIDDEAGVADCAILYSQGKITIGQRAVISQGAHLCGGTHDYNDPGFPLILGDIKIGAKAWIAAEAFIHPGITVGEGAVLGARAVAVKDLDPWTIYSGNPAKAIKQRSRL